MFEELLIQNFQAHDKLRVTFGPGITTIIGPSDVGKSAIIRALRWVATNQPGGDAFVRHGSKGATVKLRVDGRTITRKRKAGGEVNTYHLDDQEYKAFGRGVPDVIGGFLNTPGVCWQGQHDPSFWFGETAGEVSRQLNAIVNLGIIDTTLANVAKAFHRARTKLELTEERLTGAKAEADGLAWVAGADGALRVVEMAYGDAYAAAGRAATLRQTADGVQTYRRALKTATGRNDAAQGVALAARAALRAWGLADKLRGFAMIAHGAAGAAKKVAPDFAPVKLAAETYRETDTRCNALRTLVGAIKDKETTLCQKEKQLKQSKNALPKVCPVCGR